MKLHRDVYVGVMFNEMYQNNYCEEEFMFYGINYWQDGQIKQMISENDDEICAFLLQHKSDNLIASPIEHILIRDKFAQEERAERINDMMNRLGEKLNKCYPMEYFAVLNQVAQVENNGKAFDLLKNYQKELTDTANESAREGLLSLAEIALSAKTLTKEQYESFLPWVNKGKTTKAKAEDEIYRRFSGFAYINEKGEKKIYVNGCLSMVLKQWQQLIAKGLLVGGIMTKAFLLSTAENNDLQSYRSGFAALLEQIANERYFAVLRDIKALPAITESCFIFNDGDKTFTEKAKESLTFYQHLWNLV